MKEINLPGKRIAILGYGVENQALLAWLVKHGANNVTICDKDGNVQARLKKFLISNFQFLNKSQIPNIKFQTGKNYLKNLERFDIIFRTPGIPYLRQEIQKALRLGSPRVRATSESKTGQAGVKISSQIKLFFDLCPAKIIGVTGTKGKGTTVSLITAILAKSLEQSANGKTLCSMPSALCQKPQVFLGGNIGNAPMEFLDKLTKNDWVVLELSSFQLQDMTKSPNIAVVLDIKSDHLDYHKDQKEYIEAKTNIVRHQNKSDFTVINLDYLTSFEFAAISPTKNDWYFSRRKSVDLGAYISGGKIILQTKKDRYQICRSPDVILRGEHNLENICAAITASYLAGADIASIKKIVPKFPGLEHRLEYIGQKNGVKYYNDSFSTTPDTTIAAIKSFTEPIILIVGGSEKGSDYTNLGREINKSSVKTIITIGTTGPKIMKAIEQYSNKALKVIENCKNMREIIKVAKKEARSGDVVLLSPASASFDMFRNYKDRGEQFKEKLMK